MKLSILIPTTPERNESLQRLASEVWFQEAKYKLSGDVELLVLPTPQAGETREYSIGFKRNALLERANCEYIAFIDSDDRISSDYLRHVFDGIAKGVDCCSLTGIITEDGLNPLVFQHSIKYKAYKTNPEGMPVRYERYPNHLNCIKASIAKQFKFPEINHGEDSSFAKQVFESGLIKTEHFIEPVIYYYDYISKK